MKKIVPVFALIVLLLAGGFFLFRSVGGRIGRDAAVRIALTDAGFARTEVYDVDVDYERERGGAYYEVDFEKGALEYKYVIDARSGAILGFRTEP